MSDIVLGATVRRLYNWVEERENRLNKEINDASHEKAKQFLCGIQGAYQLVQAEMRTLFAGLIKFDE